MNLIWIWVSISISMIVAGAGLAYLLYASRLRQRRYEQSFQITTERVDALAKELQGCRRRLEECEQRYSPAAESGFPLASLHLNRRGQVAQLFRRGQTPSGIASVLGISQGEVKLVIKMLDLDADSGKMARQENPARKHAQSCDKASGVNAGQA
jgi:hypothetical protein